MKSSKIKIKRGEEAAEDGEESDAEDGEEAKEDIVQDRLVRLNANSYYSCWPLTLSTEIETEIPGAFTCSEYASLVSQALGVQSTITNEENVLVIQPYIKFGANKSKVPPGVRLREAEDLIRSLDAWNVVESITVPLSAIRKNVVFGSGKMDELKKLAKKYNGDPARKVSFGNVDMIDWERPD